MKVLVSWLRDFVDVPGTPAHIAATMSVRGFAVESIDAVGADDAVLDFEVTANRPDAMSILGIAREVATAYGLPLRVPGDASTPAARPSLTLASLSPAARTDVDVVIEAPDLCPRYVAAVADVRVGPSPEWMQARLRAAGVRPISNVVDVTNYVLLELGHPMHAFDLSTLAGSEIRVRAAASGESLKTLDGQTRTLTSDMLVIADARRACAVAGVMGGSDSEVHAGTTTIVLESAYFNPLSVRRTSKKLGLKTEASMRFERGADPGAPATAMARACALLAAIGAGTARGTLVDRHPSPVEPRTLTLRREKLAALIGLAVPDADVTRLLASLGFGLRGVSGGWEVTVPTRRVDVLREVDLVEEVARHYGFDRVPASFPALSTPPAPIDPRITQTRQLRGLMAGAGFFEAMTFGFVAAAAAAPFADGSATLPDVVPIANPLSETFAVLRPSILPGLLAAMAHNRRREQRDVRVFEVGNTFSTSRGERRMIACAWTGASAAAHWSSPDAGVDFFDIKAVVERICQAVRVDVDVRPATQAWLAKGRTGVAMAGQTSLGWFGQLAPGVADQYGVPAGEAVYVAEIDLDAADAAARAGDIRVEPLPRYPSVARDLSLLVSATLPVAALRATALGVGSATLQHVREFDRYQGKGVPEGQVSVSLRLTFRSPDRTLTDAEVQADTDAVLAALVAAHHAVQR